MSQRYYEADQARDMVVAALFLGILVGILAMWAFA